MATYCTKCDDAGDICDFCKHYDFNGNEKGQYTGDGICTLHQKQMEPYEGCDDFYCYKVETNGMRIEK